jgi:hypothetical protein
MSAHFVTATRLYEAEILQKLADGVGNFRSPKGYTLKSFTNFVVLTCERINFVGHF